MPEDIKMTTEDDSEKPVGKIGLKPLGKILVQTLLGPEAYEQRKALSNGEELTPVHCPSLPTAAYVFRPEVKVSAEVETIKVGDQAREVDPETLLPGAANPQVVPYWRNARGETDLTDHFDPDEIVTVMRPADIQEDRLGLLLRLRVVASTYADLTARLQDDVEMPQGLNESLDLEKERLKVLLGKVREKLLKQIRKVNETNPSISLDTIINDGSSPEKFRVADLRVERERLEHLERSSK
jgi:hypothetical protein